MFRTTIKMLNGDIFTVEHNPNYGETSLKESINKYNKEFYSECQIICYQDPDKKYN